MSHKIKIHNARQSARRLKSEVDLLRQKIALHLADKGGHSEKFIRAQIYLADATLLLDNAERELKP